MSTPKKCGSRSNSHRFPILLSQWGLFLKLFCFLSFFFFFVLRTACLSTLETVGLTERSLSAMRQWRRERAVTFRLKAEEKCTFDRVEKREEEDPTKHVRDYGVMKVENKVVRTITEYFWNFDVQWELVAFAGTDSEAAIVLQQVIVVVDLLLLLLSSFFFLLSSFFFFFLLLLSSFFLLFLVSSLILPAAAPRILPLTLNSDLVDV
jgi:hypothetical protein